MPSKKGKHTHPVQVLKGAGTKLLRPRVVLLGVQAVVLGLPELSGKGGVCSQIPPPSWFSFASSLIWEAGPCPPPAAGGLCSLAPVPGGRLPGRRQPRNCPPGVSAESLHEGGVCAAWRGCPEPVLVEGVRVRGGPCSLSCQSPLLTLQVSHRRGVY